MCYHRIHVSAAHSLPYAHVTGDPGVLRHPADGRVVSAVPQ
jgi:hypothetical protein